MKKLLCLISLIGGITPVFSNNLISNNLISNQINKKDNISNNISTAQNYVNQINEIIQIVDKSFIISDITIRIKRDNIYLLQALEKIIDKKINIQNNLRTSPYDIYTSLNGDSGTDADVQKPGTVYVKISGINELTGDVYVPVKLFYTNDIGAAQKYISKIKDITYTVDKTTTISDITRLIGRGNAEILAALKNTVDKEIDIPSNLKLDLFYVSKHIGWTPGTDADVQKPGTVFVRMWGINELQGAIYIPIKLMLSNDISSAQKYLNHLSGIVWNVNQSTIIFDITSTVKRDNSALISALKETIDETLVYPMNLYIDYNNIYLDNEGYMGTDADVQKPGTVYVKISGINELTGHLFVPIRLYWPTDISTAQTNVNTITSITLAISSSTKIAKVTSLIKSDNVELTNQLKKTIPEFWVLPQNLFVDYNDIFFDNKGHIGTEANVRKPGTVYVKVCGANSLSGVVYVPIILFK